MSKAMSPADWKARAEAYHEAAQHLGLKWTDDPREQEQGNIVAKLIERDSEKCHRIADAFTPKAA